MDCVDVNKVKEKKHPKVIVLKWGSHKHRILIKKDADLGLPPTEVPPPEPKTCPAVVDAPSALLWNLRGSRNRTDTAVEEKINRSEIENCKEINVGDKKRNVKSVVKKKESTLKLAVSLSKSEIEQDFLKMTGKKPPSRPKKRSRLAQQDVVANTMFLGLNLANISSKRYDTPK